MVFQLPTDILDKYPDAKQKVVFKEEHGYYEILLNHYVTFTANQIPANISSDNTEFKKLFESMASQQKYVTKASIDIQTLDSVDTKYSQQIIDALRNASARYKKKPADFHNDLSRYEFAYMAYLYYAIQRVTAIDIIAKDHAYTDAEKAWFLYTIASNFLPARAKHEETRDNMPWLLYLAFEVIAKNKKGNT